MSERPVVFLGFALARQPGNGGHAWVALHWLLGLRNAGFDPVLVDRFPGDPIADQRGLDWVESVVGPHDVPYCILEAGRSGTAGLRRSQLLERARRSVCLLNVMGYIDDAEILAAVPHRAFVDIDPGFVQLWSDLGLADLFAGHDTFASVGANVGRPGCPVPDCGRRWLPILPPVVPDLWPVTDRSARGVTTVGTWRGIYGPVEYGGRTFGLRVHEFRRFLDLPATSPLVLEPALDLDAEDERDRESLVSRGWRLADPALVASTTGAYQDWITGSTAELCIAKEIYVDLRTGWFSDRSACYLAAGRPVIAQDTGLGSLLPIGAGLLTFSTAAEARGALEDVAHRWLEHSTAARDLAETYLDASVVLPDLFSQMEVPV